MGEAVPNGGYGSWYEQVGGSPVQTYGMWWGQGNTSDHHDYHLTSAQATQAAADAVSESSAANWISNSANLPAGAKTWLNNQPVAVRTLIWNAAKLY